MAIVGIKLDLIDMAQNIGLKKRSRHRYYKLLVPIKGKEDCVY